MKTLVLDYAKWRAGGHDYNGENPNVVGSGGIALLNKEGFMCCLGQFSPQLNPEVTEEDMLGNNNPCHLKKSIPLLNEYRHTVFQSDTELARTAMQINDDNTLDTETRISKIKELFATVDYEVEVINLPSQQN